MTGIIRSTHQYLVASGVDAPMREAMAFNTCAAIVADVQAGAAARGAVTYGDLTTAEFALVEAVSAVAEGVMSGRLSFEDSSAWDAVDAVVEQHEQWVLDLAIADDFDAEFEAFLRSLDGYADGYDVIDALADEREDEWTAERRQRAQWDATDDDGYMY